MVDVADLVLMYDINRVMRRRRPRTYRRHLMSDPFSHFMDNDIISRFRFNREGIHYLDDLIGDNLERQTDRNHAHTREQQIAMALRYYATGSYQRVVTQISGEIFPNSVLT